MHGLYETFVVDLIYINSNDCDFMKPSDTKTKGEPHRFQLNICRNLANCTRTP